MSQQENRKNTCIMLHLDLNFTKSYQPQLLLISQKVPYIPTWASNYASLQFTSRHMILSQN